MPIFSRRRKKPTKTDLTERRLKSFCSLTRRDLIKKFDITFQDDPANTPAGLTSTAAAKKLHKLGRNEITIIKKHTTLSRLIESLVNPFNLVLIIIATVTYITDMLTAGSADWIAIIVILSMIFISSLVSFAQGERSSRAAAKLASIIKNTASVYRNSELIELPMTDLVPGDIISLSAGDMIPTDIRFLSTKDTFVAQAALTGESAPVEKYSRYSYSPKTALTDCKNLGFMGTNIISGTATAVVLATGNNTYFGSMAKTLNDDKGKNSFERGVSSISHLLIILLVVATPLVFIINGFLKADWSASLLFAVSVAVSLTPEMLPVVMTATLATGAVKMSKHNVIVKQLGAIQTFGEMDILATDKTGTLTEDKVVLEKYLDVRGEDDPLILRYAYLNAYFQTGLRSLIDIAVIERAKKNNIDDITSDYTVLSEIPFDFTRRRLSVVLKGKKGTRSIITKGAVEEILSISTHVQLGNRVQPLTDEHRATAMKTYNKYNDRGLRMLAVATKPLSKHHSDTLNTKDETDLILVGFVGFVDPPKDSAKTALASLKKSGIKVIVLTGDSLGVATHVCEKVGIDPSGALTGSDIEAMDDDTLATAARDCQLFAKLSPAEKQRIVRILQQAGHTVGYLGDGINDAPPLHQADIGISVDSAVDIAKETASIILLKKDLTVLAEGVLEGRATFGNVIKYIKVATSSNFGNMISIVVASAILPFLPMLPIQLLTQNLLSDISALGYPFDNIDPEYLKKPRKWSPKSILSFMFFMGPLSSLFDMLCFAVLFFVFGYNDSSLAPLFQSGWFIFGTSTQVFVALIARTGKIPFLQSRPSLPLTLSTVSIVIVAGILSFTPLAPTIGLSPLPLVFLAFLFTALFLYFLAVQLIKKVYKHFFHEWL